MTLFACIEVRNVQNALLRGSNKASSLLRAFAVYVRYIGNQESINVLKLPRRVTDYSGRTVCVLCCDQT